MSQFSNENYLRAKGVIKDQVISRDLLCTQCSYNLRGLKAGGQCPECGHVIPRRRETYPTMEEAPIEWLRRFRVGMLCLLVSALLWLGIEITECVVNPVLTYSLAGLTIYPFMSLIGYWIITMRKPDDLDSDRLWWMAPSLIRYVVVGLGVSLLFVVTFTLLDIQGVSTFFTKITYIFAVLLALSACWFLTTMSRWAGDNQLAYRFNVIFWIVVYVVIASAIPVFPVFPSLFELVIQILCVFAQVLYLWCIARLCYLTHRAIRIKV